MTSFALIKSKFSLTSTIKPAEVTASNPSENNDNFKAPQSLADDDPLDEFMQDIDQEATK